MAHMQALTTRIRKHVEHEVLGLRRVKVGVPGIGRVKGIGRLPLGLPPGFKIGEWKGFTLLAAAHDGRSRKRGR